MLFSFCSAGFHNDEIRRYGNVCDNVQFIWVADLMLPIMFILLEFSVKNFTALDGDGFYNKQKIFYFPFPFTDCSVVCDRVIQVCTLFLYLIETHLVFFLCDIS